MNEHEQYEAWKDQVYEALRDNVPEFAGKASGDKGNFEKAGFQVGAAYGHDGTRGDTIVTVTITDRESSRKGKQTQVEGNWRNDDPEKVATNAIAAYVKLREQYT